MIQNEALAREASHELRRDRKMLGIDEQVVGEIKLFKQRNAPEEFRLQQESIDQLQVVQDQLQTVRRLLAAQQTDTRKLSEQMGTLTEAIEGLRQSFASAQASESAAASAPRTRSAKAKPRSNRNANRSRAKARG